MEIRNMLSTGHLFSGIASLLRATARRPKHRVMRNRASAGAGRVRRAAIEALENRQLLSGSYWSATLHAYGYDYADMLSLDNAATDPNDSRVQYSTQYLEQSDGMSAEQFVKSIVTGTYLDNDGVEQSYSYSFPTDAGAYGDKPILLDITGGEGGYGGTINVDARFAVEPSDGPHEYWADKRWSIALNPAPRVAVEMISDGSENGAAPATFRIAGANGAPYAIFTLAGSATPGGTGASNLTDPDADYVVSGAELLPGSSDTYKAHIDPWSVAAWVTITPLNDARDGGVETVEISLEADNTPAQALPAFLDPAKNAGNLPAQADAKIGDLRVDRAVDADQPDPSALNDLINKLGSRDPLVREDATVELEINLANHPGIEPYLDGRLAVEDDPEILNRLRQILGPVRIELSGNKIVTSLRYTEHDVASYIVRVPGPIQQASFSVDGDPLAQYVAVGDQITITPTAVVAGATVSLTIQALDSNGGIVRSRDRTLKIDIDEITAVA